MTCIVAYDIEENRTRNRLARYLLTMGVRLQESVFAIEVERHRFPQVRNSLHRIAGKQGKVAVFRLCEGCRQKAVQIGDNSARFYVF